MRVNLSDLLVAPDFGSVGIIQNDRDAEWDRISRMPPAIREIIRQVADETGVPVFAIIGRTLAQKAVAARHEAMRRAHATGNYSTVKIGRFFNRDHTTVHYALKPKLKARKRQLMRNRRMGFALA